jgi:hypothetical protein
VLFVLVFAAPVAVPVALAQESTYLGTVAAVEPARIQVRAMDERTKQESTVWFAIDRDTKVTRGDAVVPYAEAKIARGERITVIVDPAARTKMRALEVRLGPEAGGKPPTKPAEKPTPAQPTGEHAGHQPAAAAPTGHMPPDQMNMTGWHVMQDGVVYGLFNHQGGPRGDDEFVLPNWWMGMAMREKGRHQFSLNGMFSLDPATVGKSGYAEIFQVGESLDGKPLIDRQHPHDLFMQLAASWRVSLNDQTSLTIAGGPVGEPTLGPVAFMHRPSAAGLVLAPLGHHTFDSTHISFGVVSAALERGRWIFEGSVFNGREPDEERWDFDFGRLDSFAGRVWFRPTNEWEVQASSGRLREPEELVEGDATRTTTSVSWFRPGDDGLKAVTAGYGVNAAHGERRHGVFGEATVERRAISFSGRLDIQQVETEVLLTGEVPDDAHGAEPPAWVTALTVGAGRQLFTWRGFESAIGAHVTFYGVPGPLESAYEKHPVSFQVFLRVRLPAGNMGRMWNMRMSQGHKMEMDHSGHAMR